MEVFDNTGFGKNGLYDTQKEVNKGKLKINTYY
jgi:hypothetical protein